MVSATFLVKIKVVITRVSQDIDLIQETKLGTINPTLIYSVWDALDLNDNPSTPSLGAFVGIYVIWNTKVVSYVDQVEGSLSPSIHLNIVDKGSWWLCYVNGLNHSSFRSFLHEDSLFFRIYVASCDVLRLIVKLAESL